jgi:hypothetical protein
VTAQDPGRVRASHADRDQVVAVLKVAFVQGRLTKDEFEARVGQTFASRTYAELAVVTADIPGGLVSGPAAGLAAAEPRRGPDRATKGADAWGAGLVIAAVLLVGAALIGNSGLSYLAVTIVCAAAFVTAAQALHSRHEQRLGRARAQPRVELE